tara:strand:- start:5269 stop:5553 length:285 start_codon:yes stop_codon:yes gene_type:complete
MIISEYEAEKIREESTQQIEKMSKELIESLGEMYKLMRDSARKLTGHRLTAKLCVHEMVFYIGNAAGMITVSAKEIKKWAKEYTEVNNEKRRRR